MIANRQNCLLTSLLLIAMLLTAACNKDNDIIPHDPPTIQLDSETGIYTTKVGHILRIAPTYRNVEGATYLWTLAEIEYSTEPSIEFQSGTAGRFFATIKVTTDYGSASEEIRIDVAELLTPTINLNLPPQGLKVMEGQEYVIAPEFVTPDRDALRVEWIRNGKVVATDTAYTFREEQPGIYPITIKATNEDGSTTRDIEVEVVKALPYAAIFPRPYYTAESTTRYTFAGRAVFLRPELEYFEKPLFMWAVNGATIEGADQQMLKFTPDAAGRYTVTVTVTEEATGIAISQDVEVVCVAETEASRRRPATGASSPTSDAVYEFLPAPGQFVNETATGGYAGTESTFAEAAEYAAQRLSAKKFVSLGSFGGYIIVGFDHSISAGSDYDFAIRGNATESSNEPGIVWVMQDVNGNGLPDDEWYQLKGSETGAPTTVTDYAVTYFRPSAPGSNTPWEDNLGNSGTVDTNPFHTQPYYYPAWVTPDAYTLRGVRLQPHSEHDESTGVWHNRPYSWGYADNLGSDNITGNTQLGAGQWNGFKISNAINPDGSAAALEYVDFIKVQTAVMSQCGPIGEVSTEVFSFYDLGMK